MKSSRSRSVLLFLSGLFLPLFHYAGDSLYYVKYTDRIVVSLYQSFVRQYDISFKQQMATDKDGKSKMQYYADANQVSGIELDYDKFSLAFNYKSTPSTDRRKGKTSYTNLNFTFGGTRWILETSYRKYRGFYDILHLSPADTSMYFVQPEMGNQALRAKFIYFRNHRKFAYKAAYTCTYRQLKTAGSFILASNFYYNHLYAGNSFFHPDAQPFYGSYDYWKGQKVIGLSASGGVAVNLVIFKRVFFNMTLIGGLESQWRRYIFESGQINYGNYISPSGDVRLSLGYNGKKLFFFFNSISDIVSYKNQQIDMVSKFYSFAFSIGYRFKVKTPKFYQDFQTTKIYKLM